MGVIPMKDQAKSKEQLINELMELRQRITALEQLEIEHKQSKEALRESEERYRTIVDTQRDLVCRFLPDGTLTFVNEAICRLLGQARDEIIGQNFYAYVHPDDQEKTRRNLESLSRENPLGSNEERVILPGGEMRWWRWNCGGSPPTIGADTLQAGLVGAVLGRAVLERSRRRNLGT